MSNVMVVSNTGDDFLHKKHTMSMSGIELTKECEKTHECQKKDKKFQWTIYKIADCKGGEEQQQTKSKKPKQEIVVEKCQSRSFRADDAKEKTADEVNTCDHDLWLQFINDLPDDEPRYAVFDYVGPTKSGTFNDVMRFVAWSPDSSNIKAKMIYASTRNAFKGKLDLKKETFLGGKNTEDIEQAFKDMMSEKI